MISQYLITSTPAVLQSPFFHSLTTIQDSDLITVQQCVEQVTNHFVNFRICFFRERLFTNGSREAK